MPNFFIVENQPDVAAVAARLLPTRASAALRRTAAEALRVANPTLDFERLRPGAVVVVPPEVGRLRRNAADDPAGDTADALIDEARAGLTALVAAAEAAEEQAASERKGTRELLDSREVARLSQDRLLAGNVESLREVLAQEEERSGERLEAVKQAVDGWEADLKALRGLL